MKKLCILGASGSIGQQTLDVVREHPDLFIVDALTVGHKVDQVEVWIQEFKIKHFYCLDQVVSKTLSNKYPDCSFYDGEEGLIKLIEATSANWVVSSLIGFVGFEVTYRAIELGKNIALANKETLVAGGKFIMEAVQHYGVQLTPIDSEHSALYQCLMSHDIQTVNQVIITASGGSFRDLSRDQLKDVTKEQALKHPNWSMGSKITIDSATMMNKGFEVIEAHWLYGLAYDQIKVLISPNSTIHGLVEFKDHSWLAQLSSSDMKLPIQYALCDHQHLDCQIEPLDLSNGLTLDLREMKTERYPVFACAMKCALQGESAPTWLNAINEVAVSAFLNDKIKYIEMEDMILDLCHNYQAEILQSVSDIFNIDQKARVKATLYLKEKYGI